MRKRFLVVVFMAVCAYIAGCAVADAAGILPDIGGASAMLVKGGQTKLAVTMSWHLSTLQGCDLWADGFLVQGGVGGGLSTPVLQVLQRLAIGERLGWFPPVQTVLEGLRGGMAIVRTGGDYDGGAYLLWTVKAVRF